VKIYKTYYSRIQPDGSVELPKGVAEHLQVKEGDSVIIQINLEKPDQGFQITKASSPKDKGSV
jgi:bifunctional DNA-binding transcriptional regulator/antitoxin component of YhaV-PrlF toxin-antitoxin module